MMALRVLKEKGKKMRLIDVGELINNINEFAECVKAGSEFTRGYIAAHKDFAKLLAEQPTIEQPTWIPVTERLPTEEGFYRVCHKSKAIADRYFYGDGELFTKFGNDPVTHWKPIEEPPKGDE